MGLFRRLAALGATALVLTSASGCRALAGVFVGAAFRELADDEENSRYPKQDYWAHFCDVLAEDDDC